MTDYKVGDTVRIGEWSGVIKRFSDNGKAAIMNDGPGWTHLHPAQLDAMGAQIVEPEIVWQDGDVIARLHDIHPFSMLAFRLDDDLWHATGDNVTYDDAWASRMLRQGWQRVSVQLLVGDSTLTRTTESQAQTLQNPVCVCGHEKSSHNKMGCWMCAPYRNDACTGYREPQPAVCVCGHEADRHATKPRDTWCLVSGCTCGGYREPQPAVCVCGHDESDHYGIAGTCATQQYNCACTGYREVGA